MIRRIQFFRHSFLDKIGVDLWYSDKDYERRFVDHREAIKLLQDFLEGEEYDKKR